MKKIALLFWGILLPLLSIAQTWYIPTKGYNIWGQGWTSEIGKLYQRMPSRLQSSVNAGVWELSHNSAGLYVRFKTNAQEITVSYKLKYGAGGYNNIATLNSSGVDLYARDDEGKTHWLGCNLQWSFGTDIVYTYKGIKPTGMAGKDICEYQLYFPTYNTVTYFKVGVPDGCSFEYVPVSEEKPIVVYGTSIAQGASASRPGNAWPEWVGRILNIPVINLGFSGSAMMELGVFKALSEIDARLFIIDCIPNIKTYPAAIVNRTLEGIKALRDSTNAPILLVESFGCVDKIMTHYDDADQEADKQLKLAYDAVKTAGYKNVYYLTQEEIGPTEDAQIDGLHPNDLGMKEYTVAYVKKIQEIFADQPDAISSVSKGVEARKTNVYNAEGKLVSKNPDWKSAQKTVYIVNGKKILR